MPDFNSPTTGIPFQFLQGFSSAVYRHCCQEQPFHRLNSCRKTFTRDNFNRPDGIDIHVGQVLISSCARCMQRDKPEKHFERRFSGRLFSTSGLVLSSRQSLSLGNSDRDLCCDGRCGHCFPKILLRMLNLSIPGSSDENVHSLRPLLQKQVINVAFPVSHADEVRIRTGLSCQYQSIQAFQPLDTLLFFNGAFFTVYLLPALILVSTPHLLRQKTQGNTLRSEAERAVHQQSMLVSTCQRPQASRCRMGGIVQKGGVLYSQDQRHKAHPLVSRYHMALKNCAFFDGVVVKEPICGFKLRPVTCSVWQRQTGTITQAFRQLNQSHRAPSISEFGVSKLKACPVFPICPRLHNRFQAIGCFARPVAFQRPIDCTINAIKHEWLRPVRSSTASIAGGLSSFPDPLFYINTIYAGVRDVGKD